MIDVAMRVSEAPVRGLEREPLAVRTGPARQGDWVLVRVEATGEVEAGAEWVPADGVALDSESRAAHVLRGPGRVARLGDGGWAVEAGPGGLVLDHPEHRPLRLVEGLWRISRQRMVDPAGEIRRVVD